MYERVATEVSRLKYYLVKGENLPSLQQLQPRADSAVEKLLGLLQQALGSALSSGHQSAIMHCLQAYAVIGDTMDAEQVTPAPDAIQVMSPNAAAEKLLHCSLHLLNGLRLLQNADTSLGFRILMQKSNAMSPAMIMSCLSVQLCLPATTQKPSADLAQVPFRGELSEDS